MPAPVFRGELFAAPEGSGFVFPGVVPRQWVADCRRSGHDGDEALTDLPSSVYRCARSGRGILACSDNGKVTFRYHESHIRQWKIGTLPGADFLWLLLQHVLPRGFRRVRDYGLLHHKQHLLLRRIPCLLRTNLSARLPAPKRPTLCCTHRGTPMRVLAARVPRSESREIPCLVHACNH